MSYQRLSRIKDWEGLAREAKFKPEAMAALCPCSLRHLERFFAVHFKKSPRLWARELRIRLARELITEGMKASAVATEFHFTDTSHLNRELKRFYGASSGAFARVYGSRASRRS